jgi:hypothetical protein
MKIQIATRQVRDKRNLPAAARTGGAFYRSLPSRYDDAFLRPEKSGRNTSMSATFTCPRTVLGCALLACAAASNAYAAHRLESGKWQSIVAADGQSQTLTYCITQEEAASINGDSKTGREFAQKRAQKASEPCAIKSYEINDDVVSYTMTCGNRTIVDKTIYRGETSDGVKTISKDGQTQRMEIHSQQIAKNCL